MEQEPMATQDANMPNIANNSELNRGYNEPAGEEREVDGWVLVPRMGPSTGPSEVKVHMLVAGETFQAHETFIQKLNLQIELCSAESSNVILVFCPVVSQIGTDMEVSMTRVPEKKPVILVFMHHCHHPSHMTNTTVQPSRGNIVQVVHCAFHQHEGLLECRENEQAVAEVYLTLLRYVDSHAEVLQSSTGSDIEQQLTAAQDDITPDSEPQSPEPVGERSESHRCKDVREMEDSGGSSGAAEFKVRCTYLHKKQQPVATEDVNKPNIGNNSELHRGYNEPAGEEREDDDGWVIVSRMGLSTGPSGVKVHMLVAGETFNTHETFIQKLNLQIELCSAESSNAILVFCPVVSRIGTDMEAAMSRVTGKKPVILVFMHHCHNPSHMTNVTVQPSRGNIVKVIHCAYHESIGLLQCQANEQAVRAVRSALLSEKRTELDGEESESDEWVMISPSEHSTAPPGVKAHTLVAGETFNTHETFIQKLNLQVELCSAESSDVILVFCPVASRIGTDMDAAMARVKEDKPVILVFMHHCHNPSHMTNITVQPSRSNIVQVVHCAYHQYKGLLECQENEQAVAEVYLTLLRYVNSHAEVSQSKSELEIKQQLMAAQDDITPDSEPQSTEPVGERSESHRCKDVMEMEDSGGSSGGHAPEVLQSNVDPTNVDMKEKLMAAQDGKKPNITTGSELRRKDIDPTDEERELHQRVFVPALERSTGLSRGYTPEVLQSNVDPTNVHIKEKSMADQDGKWPRKRSLGVKIHVLVAGETFQADETFMQKLNLQIELCSAESSSVILVFCPVVSRIGTDMEAAMDRVTVNKPVILVFMHHCHSPSHMTDITVQPSRSNKVQVVHCAFHETKGLLECRENEQAVAEVQAMLKRYK